MRVRRLRHPTAGASGSVDTQNSHDDTLDGTFTPFESAGGFSDRSIPANYCPFGSQAIGDSIFVTYALKGGTDDVAGVGHGFVRQFDDTGHRVSRVANHGRLNSPWGVALAPMDLASSAAACWWATSATVRATRSARIPARRLPPHGVLREDRHAITIDGLWGIGFGNGGSSGLKNVLYFAAGPDDEMNGYFGKVEVDATD